jgi:hypothetical protein
MASWLSLLSGKAEKRNRSTSGWERRCAFIDADEEGVGSDDTADACWYFGGDQKRLGVEIGETERATRLEITS